MKSIVVLASGAGSNFENIVLASQAGRFAGTVTALITDRPGAACLERAQRLKVPSYVISKPKPGASPEAYDEALAARLRQLRPDWIVLAGYLRHIGPRVLAAFPQHIVNIHPSLLPRYGGKGMYGDRVFAAVLQARESVTGVTVHMVNENFDEGRTLEQREIRIDKDETIETLRDKTKYVEHDLYVSVLEKLCRAKEPLIP